MHELPLCPAEAFLYKTLTNNLDLLEDKYSETICSICGSRLAEVIVVYRFKSIKSESQRRLPRNPGVEKCPRSLYCARVNMFESVVICIRVIFEKCQTKICSCFCCTCL